MILVIALIVKGIQASEANHAREIVNFETEQALQSVAESGIIEAAEKVRSGIVILPYSDGYKDHSQKKIPVNNPDEKIIVEVRGERGKIYRYDADSKLIRYKVYDENGNAIVNETYRDGIYFMGTATIDDGFFGEKIYRRAYAYVFDGDTTIYFMELPTDGGNEIRKNWK